MNQTALKHIIAGLQHDADLLQQLSPMLQKQYVLMSMRQSSELEQLNQKAAMLLEQLRDREALRSGPAHGPPHFGRFRIDVSLGQRIRETRIRHHHCEVR